MGVNYTECCSHTVASQVGYPVCPSSFSAQSFFHSCSLFPAGISWRQLSQGPWHPHNLINVSCSRERESPRRKPWHHFEFFKCSLPLSDSYCGSNFPPRRSPHETSSLSNHHNNDPVHDRNAGPRRRRTT